ncbi:MAG: carbamoyltransferase HypF [Burkholderiales bacterium]|nr:carbamoyltransferase HypF [Burkholderiales bacterium]
MPRAGPSVLATGAWLKTTICLTRGDEAYLSPHIGDLDNAATCAALVEMADHLAAVLDIRPTAVAHDLHPDFYGTRHAQRIAAERGLPLHAVQHHHAHIAAVAAEHRQQGPLLGLALDGVGLGSDGAAWGGELLRVDGARCERIGHLLPIALPGGDIAAREPWRMAAAALHAIGRGAEIEARFPGRPGAQLRGLLERGLRCPPTSSLGRWFDAAAGLLGLRETCAYEGQAPMLLEALARSAPADAAAAGALDALVTLAPDGGLDPRPLFERLADERDAARGAALFHDALAEGIARWAIAAAASSGLRRIACGGGCFLNERLNARLLPRLREAGLTVLEARQAPTGDGGIALGQAWVALCAMAAAGA